ncbi:MAG: CPBP family intramembrane glutamic endopeptidase, partial [Terriglobales bacterium]
DYCESFVYGVPDSGQISQGRLLQPSFHGSHWITGGSVGPEGSLWVFLVVALLFALFADLYPARTAATPNPESTASSAA